VLDIYAFAKALYMALWDENTLGHMAHEGLNTQMNDKRHL